MALSGNLYSVFGGDHRKTELEAFGYCENGDATPYNRAAVLEVLEELCEAKSTEEKRLLWWEKDGEEETIYLANPVIISLVMEEYTYTERLLKAGYNIGKQHSKMQIYATNVARNQMDYQEIEFTQVLLAQVLPKELLEHLRGCLTEVLFQYSRDYWENPLLVNDINRMVRTTIPSVDGLLQVQKYFPEMFKRFLTDGKSRNIIDAPQMLEKKQKQRLIEALIKCATGSRGDLEILFELLITIVNVRVWTANETSEKAAELEFTLKNIGKYKAACQGLAETENLYFERIADFFYKIMNANVMKDEKIREKYYLRIKRLLLDAYKDSYKIEDFLGFLKNKPIEVWVPYLKIWKQILKQPVSICRTNETVWNMLRMLFNKEDEEDEEFDYYDDDEDVEKKHVTLLEMVNFIEELGEVTEEKNCEEYQNLFVELVCGLIDVESEEMMLACIDNNWIPKELISICIDTAIKFDKLRLVPCMIMKKYQKEEA